MTQKEFWLALEEGYAECVGISKRKNADYAGKEDPFKNFRMCEMTGICSVEKGILVRMSDKFQRIANLIDKEGKVEDEKIEDTLLDLCNYSMILKIYLGSRR